MAFQGYPLCRRPQDELILGYMETLACPYCGQQKQDEPEEFTSCRICGFKSALVSSKAGELLIVDRRMPYLKRRCRELEEAKPGVTVIVDRRINQDPYDEPDRRVFVAAET